jgi:hypothetical protein
MTTTATPLWDELMAAPHDADIFAEAEWLTIQEMGSILDIDIHSPEFDAYFESIATHYFQIESRHGPQAGTGTPRGNTAGSEGSTPSRGTSHHEKGAR